MGDTDSRRVLWQNLVALMEHHWGAENLTKLAKVAGVGPGTCTRLKQQQTSVGVEIVDQLAEAFNLMAWQLLVPELDPKRPPLLLPVDPDQRAAFEALLQAARALKPPAS